MSVPLCHGGIFGGGARVGLSEANPSGSTSQQAVWEATGQNLRGR